MNTQALKDLLFRLADDDLIMGHRNSEWNAMGPVLEEDIAFASMAQDEMGHAQAYYILIEAMGDKQPDQLAFGRAPAEFRSCHFVEVPNNGDYAFSLARQFYYAYAKEVRLKALERSSYGPLAELAKKVRRELKYHLLHARTWIGQLANSTEEASVRIKTAMLEAYPMAFGLFEPTDFSATLTQEGVLPSEQKLQAEWLQAVQAFCAEQGIALPEAPATSAFLGGRKGYHSEHLPPLLEEMTAVFRLDPQASW